MTTMGTGSIAPLFLTSEVHGNKLSESHPDRFTRRGKEPSVPIEYEVGWAPETIWMVWSRETFYAATGNRTTAFQPLATPTEPSHIFNNHSNFSHISRSHIHSYWTASVV